MNDAMHHDMNDDMHHDMHHDRAATGQVSTAAAEVYDEIFVPALFGQWPDRVLAAAGVGVGHDVLDVGCGTGIVARAACDVVGSGGSVTGVDPNEGMLAVARRTRAPVDWHVGTAEALPFDDASFDHVVSQFALMFFADRARGLAEMARVTRPTGRVTVATWSEAVGSPGYAAMIDLLRRTFGNAHADALVAPFSLGTERALREVLDRELAAVVVERHDGVARFASLDAWVRTEVRGWTLADLMDDDDLAALLAAARVELDHLVQPDGSVAFSAPALIGHGSRA